MKKLIAGLICALATILIAAISVAAQSTDSISTTADNMPNGAGMMDNKYIWVGIVGAIFIIVLGIGLIRRSRRNSNPQMRKGPESDGGISNPAGGI